MSKNPYSFLYFYIHRSIKKSGSNTSVASTILLFSTLQCFNILVLLKLFKLLGLFSPKLVFSIYLLVIVTNVIVTFRKNGLNKMIEAYADCSEERHKKNWMLTLGYMLGSFFLIIIVGITLA